MPRPADIMELTAIIRRSGLVDSDVIDDFVGRTELTTVAIDAPTSLLADLVRNAILTTFQASQLALGRCRGFFVGSYKLLDRIGQGAMGRVYLAAKPGGCPVAIKVLDSHLMTDDTSMRRFVREATSAAALDHPNVVRILDMDLSAQPPYLVMEYVDGPTLQAAVARGGFRAATAAECGRQACLGLQSTAEAGLVHRDVKPANLAVTRSGTVKILDLGIVRTVDGDPLTLGSISHVVLGTADYLAPEQAIDSSAVDARADVYSLGAMLYFLLAGHPPFPNGTVAEKLSWKQSFDPPALDNLRSDVPPKLAAIVTRMMARCPADRYPNPMAAARRWPSVRARSPISHRHC